MSRVNDLLRDGRLDEVQPDAVRGREMAADAKRHVEAAATIVDIDPNGAFQLAYDAARKAVTAFMLAQGYRATATLGSHAAVVEFARERLLDRPDANRLDRMRRMRNRSEYDAAIFERTQLIAEIGFAERVLDLAREAIG
jgi:hypothetical protein